MSLEGHDGVRVRSGQEVLELLEAVRAQYMQVRIIPLLRARRHVSDLTSCLRLLRSSDRRNRGWQGWVRSLRCEHRGLVPLVIARGSLWWRSGLAVLGLRRRSVGGLGINRGLAELRGVLRCGTRVTLLLRCLTLLSMRRGGACANSRRRRHAEILDLLAKLPDDLLEVADRVLRERCSIRCNVV